MSLHTKNYHVTVIDQPYVIGDLTYDKTVVVDFFNSKGKKIQEKKYAWVDKSSIFDCIEKNEAIVLDNCYVQHISLKEYREKRGLPERTFVEIKGLTAKNAFLDCEDTLDFSFAKFDEGDINFSGTNFGEGNITFYKTLFGKGNVIFSDVNFNEGNVDFQFVEMDDGKISFQNALFGLGTISFVNTNFGNGRVNFKETNFSKGNVDFHYSKFGIGDISFDKAQFNGEKVDFRRVEFGTGKADFRRVHFGNAEVNFEESEFKAGKINFRSSKFGTGNVSFEMVDFGNDEVSFERADFGSGNVSFLNTKINTISFKSCHLNNYLDLRVASCNFIDLSDTIVRDIVDLKPVTHAVKLNELQLTGMRNLGRIFIDWHDNNVKQLIGQQKETTNRQKADQFRILKEDFRNTGQYNDEDKAYAQFKRFELKAEKEEALKENKWNAIWVYPSALFRWLVFDKIGLYATDPVRVLISMLFIYVLFSLSFAVLPYFIHADIISSVGDPDHLSVLKKSFYHSAITFLTIGYGDYYPSGHIRWLSAVEGWVGLFLMSYFTVAFVRKILR